MKIFSRIYKHFYDELSSAFMQLIDEYCIDESHTLNIGYIVEAYDFGNINVNEISYSKVKENNVERLVVEITTNDGTKTNIYDAPLQHVIMVYEIIVYYLLCIEYGIKYSQNFQRKKAIEDILEVAAPDFNSNLSANVKLLNNKGIMENSSTIEYILQALSLTQTGKMIEKDKDDFDLGDDEYISEQLKVKMTLMNKNDEYVFNIKHELFDLDLKVNDMSPYEVLAMYDMVIKNKKVH